MLIVVISLCWIVVAHLLRVFESLIVLLEVGLGRLRPGSDAEARAEGTVLVRELNTNPVRSEAIMRIRAQITSHTN